MTAPLLEMDDVSHDLFQRRTAGAQASACGGRCKFHGRGRSAGSLGDHRRIGQRQDNARAYDPQHRAADRGQHPLSRRALRHMLAAARRLAFMQQVQPIFQNPFEAFNPLKRVDRYLFMTARGVRRRRAEQQQVDDRAASGRPVAGRGKRTLSARVVGRAAAAHRHRACADLHAGADRRGRTGVDGRCIAAHVHRQSVRNLRDALGVSIIYITHDLATAYYDQRPHHHHARRARGGGWRRRVRCSTIRGIPIRSAAQGRRAVARRRRR